MSSNVGGNGAAREICDLILEAKGLKKAVMTGVEKAVWPRPEKKNLKTVLYSKWKLKK